MQTDQWLNQIFLFDKHHQCRNIFPASVYFVPKMASSLKRAFCPHGDLKWFWILGHPVDKMQTGRKNDTYFRERNKISKSSQSAF